MKPKGSKKSHTSAVSVPPKIDSQEHAQKDIIISGSKGKNIGTEVITILGKRTEQLSEKEIELEEPHQGIDTTKGIDTNKGIDGNNNIIDETKISSLSNSAELVRPEDENKTVSPTPSTMAGKTVTVGNSKVDEDGDALMVSIEALIDEQSNSSSPEETSENTPFKEHNDILDQNMDYLNTSSLTDAARSKYDKLMVRAHRQLAKKLDLISKTDMVAGK